MRWLIILIVSLAVAGPAYGHIFKPRNRSGKKPAPVAVERAPAAPVARRAAPAPVAKRVRPSTTVRSKVATKARPNTLTPKPSKSDDVVITEDKEDDVIVRDDD